MEAIDDWHLTTNLSTYETAGTGYDWKRDEMENLLSDKSLQVRVNAMMAADKTYHSELFLLATKKTVGWTGWIN
jgi:hypothetical protein